MTRAAGVQPAFLMPKNKKNVKTEKEPRTAEAGGRLRLPSSFLTEMEALLGSEYAAFLETYRLPKENGLRLNTRKICPEEFSRLSVIPTDDPVPWVEGAWFYDEALRPALSPYYHAGLFYLQEPSAMTPASLMPLENARYVLDLCAAPGGKSTALAARLRGRGVLFANDISNARAQALIKNLELFGAENAVILNEEPSRLSERFPGFFDHILIDAPCSGEGMFRKDSSVVRSYEEHGRTFYTGLQRKIVKEAVRMLAPGGYLLYSTCTFSTLEDEEIVSYMLQLDPALSVVPLSDRYSGFAPGRPDQTDSGDPQLSGCIRIYPHRMRGEGHFAALLKKAENSASADAMPAAVRSSDTRLSPETAAFLAPLQRFSKGPYIVRNGRVYLAAFPDEELKGLRVLRNGLFLGEEKTKRFEPAQALAMALYRGEFPNRLDLPPEDPRVFRYLKGETLELSPEDGVREGIVLVTVSGYPLGFAKKSGTMLKNRYLPGWRFQGNVDKPL